MVRESITIRPMRSLASDSLTALAMRSDCSSKLWTWNTRRLRMLSLSVKTCSTLSMDSPSVSR